MLECRKNGFTETIKKLNIIYDELLIIENIDTQIKLIASIADDIVAIVPYKNDIRVVADNISSVKNAYQNAQIAQNSATIATNAQDVSITEAQKALSSANSAHLSALSAGERAEYVDDKAIKLVALIDTHNNEIAVSEEHIIKHNRYIELSIIKHNRYIELSHEQIEIIRGLISQKAVEVESAKQEAINKAVISTQKALEAKGYRDTSKGYRDEAKQYRDNTKRDRDSVYSVKSIVVDLANKSAGYKDEAFSSKERCEVIYDELKGVDSPYDIKKELYTLRTGTIYEIRGV
jgi:hypothetical protein